MRRIDLGLLACVVLCGCASREPELPPNSGNLSQASGGMLMPAAEPTYNAMLVADPGTVRPLTPPKDLPPVELGLSFATSAPSSQPEESSSQPASSQSAEEEEEEEETEGSDLLEAKARPAVNAIPSNPAARSAEAVDVARMAGTEVAQKELRDKIGRLPAGEEKSVTDLLGDAATLESIKLDAARVVTLNWLDADHLDVEIEMTLSDVIEALKAAKGDADFSGLTKLGASKCVAASGTGEIPADKRG